MLCFTTISITQTETATISGRVTDQQGHLVEGAEVVITNVDTNSSARQASSTDGLYIFSEVKPGRYRINVTKGGFQTINLTNVVLNVQDSISQNFRLQVGSVSQSITVLADEARVNTESAVVSTLVDRQFAENLPMNGRSFQTLIQLTPGVVVVPAGTSDNGQFSINGQRAASNYWTVDGVSANIGAGSGSTGQGQGFGGALPGLSAQGGTNSLVSIDALQEFRIQTSTYAPEFGRTPGGQISIVTRSGTNQFHGSTFDYFRNDVLDANGWFNGYTNVPPLPKAEERQNDFGGAFSGPILRNRTFFFFSYEGLRLRLPQTALSTVPDISARQAAISATQPLLNAFPIPNGTDFGNGIAQFNASYSNASTLNATSLRIDHIVTDKVRLFGRYNYSPSQLLPRAVPLSELQHNANTLQTATVGATWSISAAINNDLRFNYSRSSSNFSTSLGTFGGATPLTAAELNFPTPFTLENSILEAFIRPIGVLHDGNGGSFLQQQYNVVDGLVFQKSSHSIKLGIDYRRLNPSYNPSLYALEPVFSNMQSVEAGKLLIISINSTRGATFGLQNLGAFAQDTWRINPRLTVTYGLRWDLDWVPSSDPALPALTNVNLSNLSTLALARSGTSPYSTTYGNIAPRLGAAYQVSKRQGWETVFRGGFGVFYDLASQEVGNSLSFAQYPFGAVTRIRGGTYPLSSAQSTPPPITVDGVSGVSAQGTKGYDPNLKLPYTLQWNIAVEQALGSGQTISASYVGAAGRRLLQTADVISPNTAFAEVQIVTNAATSDYQSLQVQYQRRLLHGLQALASYTWSHSIDSASAGSAFGNAANDLVPGVNPNANRGPSDFDIRNTLSVGMTYEVRAPKINRFTNAIMQGWSLQNVIQARSAPPVDVFNSNYGQLFNGPATNVRPDLVPGIPLYVYGPQYPGGKSINNTLGAVPGGCSDGSQSVGPFCPPPIDPNTFLPLRQGNLGRNALRGFGAAQWDLAIHRDFPIHERLRLQFRAEMFNVLNNPNFAPPVSDLSNTTQFGRSIQMLGQSLGNAEGFGGFSALYQIGGSRSIQLALKLLF
jgi:hypothetical protein